MNKLGKTLLVSAMFISLIPAKEIKAEVTKEDFEAKLPYVNDITIRYTSTPVNIRTEPNTNSEILDTSLVNTAFEIVLDIDGWAMITTEDGYAYMKSDWFVDSPIKLYTDKDLYIMAHLLAGECQCYPDLEQKYVGSVALNRIKSNEFPNTLEEVVFQKGQYACTWDGNYYREPTERNWANAKWLLENGSILPEHVVFQSGGRQGNVYLKTKYHYYCY